MIIIGLTGQTGSGKSTVTNFLAEKGIPSLNADEIYHALLLENKDLKEELIANFGKDIADENGEINRIKLAATVFGKKDSPALLHTLNNVTHKCILARMHELAAEYEKKGVKAILYDAPQLFEAGVDKECNCIIGVIAHRDVRISRIVKRDGMTLEAATARVDAQLDEQFFKDHCHYILENNGSLESFQEAVRALPIDFGVN